MSAGPPASLSPERIRQGLEEVFQRTEFREPPSEPSWLVRALLAVFAWLGRQRDESPALFWLILLGCLVSLALLVVLVVRRVKRTFHGDGALSGTVVAGERQRLSAGYAEEARRQASLGDFTEAIRCLFLSLVYRLDESGRVGFQKAYTNHEYLDLVANQRDVREGLRLFVEALDEHWYGQRPATPERYRECLARYERLT